MTLWAFV